MRFLEVLPFLGAVSLPFCQAYTWKNVHIGGGGGFTPGIVFNTKTKGVAYARTDIGGIYKLNADDSWTPLTDQIAQNTTWHNWGIDALASDPVDSDRLFAAVGMYTNSWDPNTGSIIRSADQGSTWEFADLPFKVGGNMPGRGMGERLAVDPQNNSIIYFGARSGNGLWKSTDQGISFQKVESFTAVGNYAPDPTDTTGYESDLIGLAWITFDSNSALVEGASSRIFVGVADTNTSIYVTNDAGSIWAPLAGQPANGWIPHKGKLAPGENALYITYSDTSGPYDGANGTVNRYSISNGTWKDISPVSSNAIYFGWGGLGIDLQNPGTLVVASIDSYYPDGQIWRTTDSGATWSPIWEYTDYPEENYYYSYNTDKAPWINNSRLPTDTKKLGWMIESLEIDPFDSNHWLYGTGLTIYGGHDLTNWDTIHNITVESLADCIEEMAVQQLASVPGGPTLLSAVSDDSGFTQNDITVSPEIAWSDPLYGTSTGVDYAGNAPTDIVRCGDSATDGNLQVAVSSDGGQTWSPYPGTPVGAYGGKVAYSADGTAILWSSATNGMLVSHGSNGTFEAVTSLPSGALIASDKQNGSVFYAAGSDSDFYISTDSGSTFSVVADSGLDDVTSIRDMVVNPVVAGDVWLSSDVGVFHSTSYGSGFSLTSDMLVNVDAIALGKGAGAMNGTYGNATTSYNVYAFGDAGNGTASDDGLLYMSTDMGVTWANIQGTQGFGSDPGNLLAASWDVAGLVFVGTNGRGVFYGTP